MKRFIIISMMAAAVWQSASGCIWIDNHNHYLFNVCDKEEFSSRTNKITIDNWKTYLGTDEEYWWFKPDEIVSYARQKGDDLMVSYVQNLEKYLDCASSIQGDRWNYPSKEDLAKRNQTLTAIRTYAQSKLKTRLRSQHALLFMRCNMVMGRHAENVNFWEQTASQYIETVYKEMMQNIYAGALYKTGRADEAGRLFAEQGDWNSLMTQYYKKRSFAAIRQEYLRDPNSAVLPFLLQDFVNNAQEAIDGQDKEDQILGKLFVRDIQRSEAQQMWQFAGQVVNEGKTQQPALWKSAQAWLEYLFGNHRQALKDINEAATLDGAYRIKDNARVLKLYITSAEEPQSTRFDLYLAGELEWLDSQRARDGHYTAVYDRLVHQVLADKYAKAGRQSTTLALYKAVDSYIYAEVLDTMKAEQLQKYYNYVTESATNLLDRYLKSSLSLDETEINDLMGTKYLRLCKWDEAIQWLSRVPLSYYNGKGYAVYAANRRYTVEPWIKRQWLRDDVVYGDQKIHLPSNPKLDFAREVQKMEGELTVLSGKARQQRCYDLAVRYAQASFSGDCWFLMRDGKSVMDTVRVNEVNLAARAASYLRQAAETKDAQLKERVLFAQSYVYLNPERWCSFEWNSQEGDYNKIPQPQASQYKAFAKLAEFERSNTQPARYISLCDEYQQFKSVYR